ncbi:MAG TPA: hypothetical protein VE441_10925 [Mycobacterium sp.]|nr:hypothetical protein [Mycobacterium sp.]
MTGQTKPWEQVGKRFEAVGAQLRRRIEEANEDAVADRAAFEKAVHALFRTLDDSIEAASRIVRDPVLHKQLSELAESMRTAVNASFEGAREHLSAARKRERPKPLKPRVPKSAAHKPTASRTTERKVVPHQATAGKPATSK